MELKTEGLTPLSPYHWVRSWANWICFTSSQPVSLTSILISLSMLLRFSKSMYGCTTLCWAFAVFFSFLIFYTVGRTPWTGDQPVARPLSAHRTAQTQNKRTQTPMPQVGFEPTIPVFERAKTLHVLYHAAIVIGRFSKYRHQIFVPYGLLLSGLRHELFSLARTPGS
jgi:hypothetical protein